MKTQLEELDSNRVRLTVEVPADDVDHAFEHALSDLSQSVRMPGFRKGKAPKGLVMQRILTPALCPDEVFYAAFAALAHEPDRRAP